MSHIDIWCYYYEPDITLVTSSKKSSSSASPEMLKAKGKRVLVASEPDDEDKDSKFRVNRLKQLRGNDMIQTRGLYKDFIEFRPQFGMIFQMNDKPELSKVDDAIGKSLKIIEFPYQFVSEPQYDYQRLLDSTLKRKFEEDPRYRQQFMLILLAYHKRYVKTREGYQDPPEVHAATKEYIEENNPIAQWFQDNYIVTNDPRDRIKVDDMYTSYHPKPQGFTKKKLGHFMTLLGYKSKINNSTRYYVGMTVKERETMIREIDSLEL